MAKAKNAKAKKAKRSARKISIRVVELPLDDARWMRLIEAYKLLSPQTEFATVDLLEALKSDSKDKQLRCMRRSLTNPNQRERVPTSYWRGVEIDIDHNTGRIQIYRGPAQAVEAHHEFDFGDVARAHRGYFRDPQTRLDEDWAFFVWKPDFDARWPALSPQVDDGMTTTRAKPGRKPKGDWYTLIAAWLIAVAADEPKRLLNVNALVVEATDFLEDKIDWAPAEAKDLRKKIVELLQLVPR
jgi:hypothetical protein